MDWRTIDTSNEYGLRQLDEVIAHYLGWRFVKLDEPEVIYPKLPNGEEVRIELWWYTLEANGEKHQTAAWQTQELAWEHTVYPNFTTDLNEAFRLVETVPGTFRLQSAAPDIWQAWFSVAGGTPQATEASPSLAICKAWLAFKDQQNH